MLRRFTAYVIALLELAEAEATSAVRAGLVRAGRAVALLVAGIGLLVAAAALLVWAAYQALLPYWGKAGSGAACAVLLALFGAIFLWLAASRDRKR
ncbi:MAG TPA: hypothetical protein PKN52_06840 [Trueperaceae bacterium]|nr:hypothetical protein [Trueperaceae bacterium]